MTVRLYLTDLVDGFPPLASYLPLIHKLIRMLHSSICTSTVWYVSCYQRFCGWKEHPDKCI